MEKRIKKTFYIKIDQDFEIELPSEHETEDRIKLCQKIINEYPQYFDKEIHSTSYRLEVMANYILASTSTKGEYPILSEYKEKRNKKKEIVFSEFEHKYDKNCDF